MGKLKSPNKCIIHLEERPTNGLEHIVSESFGNTKYILDKGCLCDECNNSFSDFERIALGKTILSMERARQGVPSKAKKPAKLETKGLKIEGHPEFRKNYVLLNEVDPENIKNFDPQTGVFNLYIPSFEKSASATSKLLLKTGIEALYHSKREIYDKYDLTALRNHLLKKDNTDWPFMTSTKELDKFRPIPRATEIAHLAKVRCILTYAEFDDECIFKFKYGAIPMLINLSSRSLEWMADYCDADKKASIYPEHYRKKVATIA